MERFPLPSSVTRCFSCLIISSSLAGCFEISYTEPRPDNDDSVTLQSQLESIQALPAEPVTSSPVVDNPPEPTETPEDSDSPDHHHEEECKDKEHRPRNLITIDTSGWGIWDDWYDNENEDDTLTDTGTDTDNDQSDDSEGTAGADASDTEDMYGSPEGVVDETFPDAFYCSNDILLLAESMSTTALENTCDTLAEISERFHDTLQTQYQVVDNDHNDLLEIRIFNSYISYLDKIQRVSGLNFSTSGGFFYEGDASDENNNANIYVFEKSFSHGIWNIEHEFVHHLNARYIKYGNTRNTENYLFWEEGIAEYFSHEDEIRVPGGNTYSIENILNVNTNSGETAIYTWSYWLVKYLIEEKPEITQALIFALHHGDFVEYEAILERLADDEESHFQDWLSEQ